MADSHPSDFTNSSESELNEVLTEKGYRFIRMIGAGGSAKCYLVWSEKYQMNFVCKVLLMSNTKTCKMCELQALKQLSSAEIICLYDFDIRQLGLYLFLEYCPGGSLLDVVKQDGPLKGKKLLSTCKAILEGIDYIHKNNFAHLDIKPANILINKYGRPKLADFGISRFIQNQTTDKKAGTILFMPPEMFINDSFDPFKADIWSLGVTFFYLATGRTPWLTTSKEDVKKSIMAGSINFPRNFPYNDLAMTIRTMLYLDPTERPSAEKILKKPFWAGIDKKDAVLCNAVKCSKISESKPSSISKTQIKFEPNANFVPNQKINKSLTYTEPKKEKKRILAFSRNAGGLVFGHQQKKMRKASDFNRKLSTFC